MNVKIIGAGSIGNHLSHAARNMGWDVSVTDVSEEALERMSKEIYPSRYGGWDENIKLFRASEEPKGSFDLIIIGTPPDTHLEIALQAMQENPNVLLIEKPLCDPFSPIFKSFKEAVTKSDTKVVVGYNHSVTPSVEYAVKNLNKNVIGEPISLDVEFREDWEGIFKAHPWLEGPHDSYLGFSNRGGGASGEHSHALHLGLYLAESVGLPSSPNDFYFEKYCPEGKDYDSVALFRSMVNGKRTNIVQDLIVKPHRKWFRVQGSEGSVEWHGVVEIKDGEKGDRVLIESKDKSVQVKDFVMKRPDYFIPEMKHISGIIDGSISYENSPLNLKFGIDVTDILAKK